MIEDENHAAEPITVDDLGDGDEDDGLRWWSVSSMTDSRGLAVAALILAAISLIGIEAAREIATSAALNYNSFLHSQAIVDGIQVGVAAFAVGLGLHVVREDWDAEEASWAGWVARAALVVGALAFVIDIVAVIVVLAAHVYPGPSQPQTGG